MTRLALLLMLAFTASVAAATPSGTYVVVCGHFTIEPASRIDLSGTSSSEFTDLRWRTWTSTQARATGTFLTNTCNPSCATGSETAVPAHLQLSHVVSCRGKRVFNYFAVTGKRGRLLMTGSFRSLGYLLGC
jgi:hypothetical protein